MIFQNNLDSFYTVAIYPENVRIHNILQSVNILLSHFQRLTPPPPKNKK